MPQTSPQSYVAQRSFVDFDDLAAAARQWDLDFCQLDRGTFRGDLLQFGVDNVHITDARFGRTLSQKGSPPAGLRTIGVPAKRNVRFSWRGKQVSGDDLVIFPRGAELSSVSNPDFHVYTCSFPEDTLATVSAAIQVDELNDPPGDSGVVRCNSTALASARKCLRELCRAASSNSSSVINEHFIGGVTRDLPRRLLSAIVTAPGSCAPVTSRKRELAVIRAEAYIERFASQNPSVGDICRAAQVSQRTLEYAFVERYGMPPKAFLVAFRLNAVRSELRAAEPCAETVVAIANRWGFWHMGQFAADYRKQFGELPSQTLRSVAG